MNSWQSADYLLFPPQPTIDWTAAILPAAGQKPENLAVVSKVPVGSATADTPLQMRIAHLAPGSVYSSVSQGALSAANSQPESVKPLTYAQTLKSSSAIVQDTGVSDTRERWVFQRNLVRIQNALHVGVWIPSQWQLPVNAMSWNIGRQMDSYCRQLKAELVTVDDPLERCLRVSVCLSTLVQRYNCLNNGVALNYLKSCFGALFHQTLQPCIAAIKAQATAGNARDYFEVLHFILNFFQYYPVYVEPEGENIRSEITLMLESMIEVELDYLRYTLGFRRRGEVIWLICGLKQLLAAKGLIRRVRLISDETARACLQQLQVLESALQKSDLARLDSPSKIDLLIGGGDIKTSSELLAAESGVYPFQERLLYEILKNECLKLVANQCQAVSFEQELAQLMGLNLFARTYRAFIGSHYFLLNQVHLILSDLIARMLTWHKTKISHHEKRREAEAVISELAECDMLSDHCLSLWQAYRHTVLPVEESLAGFTSRDGLALFKSIADRLSAKTCTDEDYQQSANQIRRWVKNENIIHGMSQGPRLIGELNELRHRLYMYFFHRIFVDGFIINKYDLIDYQRVIEVMDQHREHCLKNQDKLFLLKNEHHLQEWEDIACRAWGKLICTVRKRLLARQTVNEAELDDILSLGKVSPYVEHVTTRVELKKMVIDVFKTAVREPEILQVSPYKLERLAYWALAVAEADLSKYDVSSWRNDGLRKRIGIYFEFVRQQYKVSNRTTPPLHPEVERMLTGKSPLHGDTCTRDQIGEEQMVAPVYKTVVSTPPVNAYHESLLDYLPLCIIKKDSYRRLEDSFGRIGIVLGNILNEGVINYEDIAKKELDSIGLCLANLAPWFLNFCSQKECKKFSDELMKLTKSDADSNNLHQAFVRMIANRIRQGDIAGASNIICVQQGLYRVRTALGLPAISQKAL